MTVLEELGSALRCLHIERGVREGSSRRTAALVGNVLTSVICVCLSGTRQRHGRERHALQRATGAGAHSLSGGGGRGGLLKVCCCYPDFIPTHMHMHTHILQTHGWVQLFQLFISYYQVISGNFISNQSAAVIYLHTAP